MENIEPSINKDLGATTSCFAAQAPGSAATQSLSLRHLLQARLRAGDE
ncbi:hypothetical protein OAN22_00720 [Alphaproteobacteria bacterium]|nr:hypothetical protein [Alphaproteobacteria bacterium]